MVNYHFFHFTEKMLTFHICQVNNELGSSSVVSEFLGEVCVARLFIFLWYLIMCLCVLSFLLWCSLRLPHSNDVRCVFTFSCLQEGSCLIYVICVCLIWHSGVQHILCCVFCFVSLRLVSCVPNVASFSGLSFLYYPFGVITIIFCNC